MGRLILAPVGMQPGAVLAPLRTLAASDDELVLLCSPETKLFAQRIAAGMKAQVRATRVEDFASFVSSDRGRKLSGRDDLAIVANGGHGRWLFELADLAPRASWIESQGGRWTTMSPGGSSSGGPLTHLGVEPLLDLLNVGVEPIQGQAGHSRLFSDHGELRNVTGLTELGGQLFAIVDARKWGNLERFRAVFERRRFLHSLGLEPRRVCVIAEHYHQARLESARVRYAETEEAAERWWDAIQEHGTEGTPATILSSWDQLDPSTTMLDLLADASARPLVLIQSTSITTLEAVWAHRPSRVFLLIDQGDVVADKRAAFLQGAIGKSIPLERVPFHRSREGLPTLDTACLEARLAGEPVDVNVTPGDKLARLQLFMWARRAGHQVWQLDGATVSSGTQAKTRDLPLVARMIGNVGRCKVDVPGRMAGAPEIAMWIAQHGARDYPWVALETAPAPGLRYDVRAGVCLIGGGDTAHRLPAPAERVVGHGHWLEDVVAALLLPHVDELWTAPHVGIREELDLVARIRGRAIVVECKAGKVGFQQATAAGVRGRADTWLGERAGAVLVVPWLDEFQGAVKITDGHWRYGPEDHATDIVDVRLLTDPIRIRALVGATEEGAVSRRAAVRPP